MSIIGLDVGGTKMTTGVVSNGKVRKTSSCQTNGKGTIKEILDQITGLLDGLVTADTKAIGVGVPGLVDKEGVAYETVNIPAWKKVPLKRILEKRYGIPAFVNNDANCFALGEKYFGKGKKYNNIAAVTLGTGMGTGIIINGQLYNGAHSAAGEFGQVLYKHGIMEQYSSGQFFLKKCEMNGDEVFARAKRRDLRALETYDEYGYHLGKALSLIVYAVDPEIIILGGSVSKAFRYFEKAMKKSLKESSYKKVFSHLKIDVSANPRISLLGAASLCLKSQH